MRRPKAGALVALALAASACARPQPAPPPPPPAGGPGPPPPAVSTTGQGIPELPYYPGARQVSYSVDSDGSQPGRKYEAELETADPFEQVKAHYQAAVQTNGWQILEYKEEPGKVEWDLAKGLTEAEIDVEQKRVGAVSIRVKRDDR